MYKNWVNSHKLFNKKRYNCRDIISNYKPEIAEELLVYAWDKCHLQGDDIFNYSGSQAWWGMGASPMPYALWLPHVTDKGYTYEAIVKKER